MTSTPLASQMTFFYKKILPPVWFGFLIAFLIKSIGQDDFYLILAVVLVLGAASYFLLFATFFAFADEVYDEGQYLRIIKGKQNTQIPLQDIKTILYSHDGNPPKVVLTLKNHSATDKPVSFMPTTELGPFKKNEKITSLINRIERLQND